MKSILGLLQGEEDIVEGAVEVIETNAIAEKKGRGNATS